ncbi:MAG: cell division protein FtsZ [Spirochaetia bacterium]|nr:cell division protein FtsZ [Spirochaetia bacterium]
MLAFEENDRSPAIIKVVGVGGAGMNAVERMVSLDLSGVEIIAMNTDEQVLKRATAHLKIPLGNKLTRGMGAGGRPEVGAQAAIEDRDKIVSALKGSDMVFITAGMGGGTGTGASPIVAEVAKELKALTVGVVSMPFKYEGQQKMEYARKGQINMREKVDTLITIPNDAIFKVIDRNTPINLAFKAIDDVLARSVIGISDIINSTGLVNVDFADIRTVMSQNGDAVIGVGFGEGENRISDALQQAIHHPLLEGKSIEGARAVLINVVGGSDLTLYEYTEIQETIHELVSKDAHIIVGFTEDSGKEDQVNITVIATGFKSGRITSIGIDNNAEEKKGHNQLNNEKKNIYEQEEIPQKKTGTDYGSIKIHKNQSDHKSSIQQGFNFPNLETDLDKLNIPAFLRKNK